MRVLVTGVAGFVGPVVARTFAAAGHTVHGLARRGETSSRLDGVPVTVHAGDVTDAEATADLVADLVPDAVVHLAAWASPAAAESDPWATYAVNVGGTLAVLAAVRAHVPRARVLAVSSCFVYGVPQRPGLPLDEEAAVQPLGVYGASKAAAEVTALQWHRGYGLDVVVARPFNHTGPGQTPDYVCSALARQVAAIEAGRQPPILDVGNVDAVRDFTDVADVAAAYLALVEGGRTGTAYNVCAGEGVSVAEVIALLRSHARVPLRARPRRDARRSGDVERLVGSRARITGDTGWVPRTPLTDTLAALLDDWRRREGA